MEFESEPLTDQHDSAYFSCGVETLDHWLKESALHAAAMNTARTFVWVQGGRVVAYYALAAHQVVREDVPARIGRGGPNPIPAVLLAKLALDVSLGGRGLGGALLGDALDRVLTAVQTVAARLVVVDAENENAIGFYEHYGFARTAPDSFRLVQKMSAIAAAWNS
ncbi:MAG: GNAT family N-acetyltransferase [Acidimicrobiales bacterium]